MIKDFVKRNRIYITLFFLIVTINVAPMFMKEEKVRDKVKTEVGVEEEKDESPTLFMEFDEAQDRSKKIENILKNNIPLYLFYICCNLLIVFMFFSGLALDGYFLFNKLKKKDVLQKTDGTDPPRWKIGDVFKIVILAFTFGYLFFMALSFCLGALQSVMKTKFTFFKNNNIRMILDTVVLDFIALLIILKFMRKVYKKKFASLGFVKKNIKKNILYGICGYVAIVPVILILGILVYILLNILQIKPPPQPIVGLFLAEKNIALIFTSSIIAAIFGPVIEEIFFRGVMYNAVKRKFGVFAGIFITSILFSFLHTHAMTYFLVGFIPIMILGMTLAYLYEKTGSLIPSITLHIMNNVGSVFMVFLFRYFNNLVK
ncbi:MAG: CPBP family intramembrane metalloprotease [Candidatus Omnitrophica bacterium]|nr:CPBP family intramembrane metalloprotease [Candidatus Omnitrophota bacterium]